MLSFIVSALDRDVRRKMAAAGIASTILAAGLVTTIAFFGGVFWSPWGPNPHPNNPFYTIDEVAPGSFADFWPYEEAFTPNAPVYGVAPALSNVANLYQFPTLPSSATDMIEANGFAVAPQTEYEQIHEILIANENRGVPIFISTDAVLHAYHVLYDLTLREMEVYSFWNLLGNLTAALLDASWNQYQSAPAGRWTAAALRNVMFFQVALSLLDNETAVSPEFPPEVEAAVLEVLGLIEDHSEMTDLWFMNYEEDFTQFVPRGHYTRSEVLERYFQAMMWYGRVSFRLQPLPPPTPNEQGMNSTAQAILLSLALTEPVVGLLGSPTGLQVWDALYEPTAFFVGSADDLVPSEYLGLIEEIYGESVSLGALDNDPLLEHFIDAALELRAPLILGHPIPDTMSINQTIGLRFMGQRYIPDSYILSQLVYTNVGTQLVPRLMPSGLDVMAALGSDRAWELLDSEKDYVNYVSQMEFLWNQIGNMTESEWTQNLYYLWLYSLLPLLSDPGEGYPFFMQSDAWVDKQLSTALGSWAELRHDTILYAKQSYTVKATGLPPEASGYVEPVPALYARLASLCRMMMEGLDSRSLLSTLIEHKLETLHSFLLSLQTMSIKELTGAPLNATEYGIIRNSGYTLASVVELPTDDLLVSDADDDMAVIADVHTDPNTEQVLEVGVGRPMMILVAVPIAGQVVLARGGVFSYYEFTWPMEDRLTDEAWQQMLDSGQEPPLPSWTASFIVAEEVGFLAVNSVSPVRRK